MASTVTLSGDWLQSVGSEFSTSGTLNLGVYATGGVAVTPAQVGLGSFIGAPSFSAQGYTFAFVAATNKVLAYVSAGFTPAGSGTAAAQTFTGESYTPAGTNAPSSVTGSVVVKGGGIGEATGINPDSTSGVLSKAAATDRAIPIATYLGVVPAAGAQTFTGSAHTLAGTNATSAVTFTGTAVPAAALIEVANGVDLSAVTINFRAFGSA